MSTAAAATSVLPGTENQLLAAGRTEITDTIIKKHQTKNPPSSCKYIFQHHNLAAMISYLRVIVHTTVLLILGSNDKHPVLKLLAVVLATDNRSPLVSLILWLTLVQHAQDWVTRWSWTTARAQWLSNIVIRGKDIFKLMNRMTITHVLESGFVPDWIKKMFAFHSLWTCNIFNKNKITLHLRFKMHKNINTSWLTSKPKWLGWEWWTTCTLILTLCIQRHIFCLFFKVLW